MKTNTTMNLTEAEVNELRFILANINSPSKDEARELANVWQGKLAKALRAMHPSPVQTLNVN